MPFAILPTYVALEKLDRSLIEAATDLGDGPMARFLRVTLPLSMPGVTAAALMIFIPTVGDYVTPQLVGGPDGLMIANAIGTQFGRSNNWPLGSALSLRVADESTGSRCRSRLSESAAARSDPPPPQPASKATVRIVSRLDAMEPPERGKPGDRRGEIREPGWQEQGQT